MEKFNFICIGCPMGCELEALKDENNIKITGNLCKIGEKYGIEEVTNPTRMITSSVKVLNGDEKLISIKTEKPIPKDKIMECAIFLKDIEVNAPIHIGDIIVNNILSTGINMIATRNVNKVT